MNKAILICIDGSKASSNAVAYVGFLFGKGAKVRIDLLHILPDIPPLFLEPGENMTELLELQGFGEQIEEENRRRGEQVIEKARNTLVKAGMDPSKVETSIREPSIHVARDILEMEKEAQHGGIVLGRHGMSAVEEFFMGSTTHRILQHAEGMPLCVVHGEVDSRKVLVPVVSSPNSKRVLDKVAWLLAEAGPMEVTIMHVSEPLIMGEMASMWTGLADVQSHIEERVSEDAEDMLDQAKAYLIERDVPPFAITTRFEKRASGVARTILDVAGEGAYGTIMIGRRGISRAKRFLFGSVSNKVVQHARDMAVWVVS
jgi:nucleotide-binding universal stress UspA family protein